MRGLEMSHSKLGPKALGLWLLTTLSVMALVATSAQAKGHVFVNLQLLNSEVEFEALKPIHGELLSTYGLFNQFKLQVLCGEILLHDGLLAMDGSSSGQALFSNCQTKLQLETNKNCKPLEPIVAKFKTLLIHHNGDTYILISPQAGSAFTTIHLGPLCPIGQNIEVRDHLIAECGRLVWLEFSFPHWKHEDCNIEYIEQEIRQAPNGLFPSHTLKFGNRLALLDGDINLATKGVHEGLKWFLQATL
jgi:hypothetical protein